ncbi:3857_t:CDS:2, partial [Gigaspora rosea]
TLQNHYLERNQSNPKSKKRNEMETHPSPARRTRKRPPLLVLLPYQLEKLKPENKNLTIPDFINHREL